MENNNNITINLQNYTEEERKQLLNLIEKGNKENKPKSKAWKPKDGEIYFCFNALGDVYCDRWASSDYDKKKYSLGDKKKYSLGNCFKTREEAEFEVERLKVIAELKRFAKENNDEMDWYDGWDSKYYIRYDYDCDIVDISYNFSRHNDIYFSSEEIALNAIEAVGEDRIKKYYLRVED